jgi:hypothetical protein
LLRVVMTSFARFLGLEVDLLSFWLYGHAIKPDDTVSNLCCIYHPFAIAFANHSLCSSAWKRVTLLESTGDGEFNMYSLMMHP